MRGILVGMVLLIMPRYSMLAGEPKAGAEDAAVLDACVITRNKHDVKLELILLPLPPLSPQDVMRRFIAPLVASPTSTIKEGDCKRGGNYAIALVLSTVEDKPKSKLLWIYYTGGVSDIVTRQLFTYVAKSGAVALGSLHGDICVVVCESQQGSTRYTVAKVQMDKPIAEWPLDFSPEKFDSRPVFEGTMFKKVVKPVMGHRVFWTKAIYYNDRLLIVSGVPNVHLYKLDDPTQVLNVDLKSGIWSRMAPTEGKLDSIKSLSE